MDLTELLKKTEKQAVLYWLYSTRSQSALFDAPFWLRLRQSQKKCSTAWQAASALFFRLPRLAQKCAVKNAHILTALSIACCFLTISSISQGGGKWHGDIPSVAVDQNKWIELSQNFLHKKMPFSLLAASERMLTYFTDLKTKEVAYRNIVYVADIGYPFSLLDYFIAGDIEPEPGASFLDSYYLYKAVITEQRGMHRWARFYYGRLDKEQSSKYLLHDALVSYQHRDLEVAKKQLQKALSSRLTSDQQGLAKKIARTLARIYFEKEDYERSQDIYENFLLHVNPVTPSDWLEAAWNLYYLKQYDRALGMLFNLEAVSAQKEAWLEKYLVRGLIYQKLCATSEMEKLIHGFEGEWGEIIHGIKKGENYSGLMQLRKIRHPESQDFAEITTTLDGIEQEASLIEALPQELHKLAEYLQATTMAMLRQKSHLYAEQAYRAIAEYLVVFSESLRFLKFDVVREKYNPEAVFQEGARGLSSTIPLMSEFQVLWKQTGDYWRDERGHYRALLKNQCQ